ncbi:unnamed protein product [Tilletia controversa]|uniref:Uncharacterized protein n=2 Tax=Tilletia TaxID=13289 RepID=A0A9N8MB46_9BASI|nr:hypothetical protein CF336_g5904 [Tilletia laevis]KAE8248256.1 hypothetical protein A4X03_0g6829 [Tilletia caries]CAD6917557.1 unnamed protein product [Tilletia controversa]CAD6956488.1 unnamed protein product [Tilletia laevis]CAD6974820.1 unnamed protein product [Tilletia controversa]
MVDEGLEVVFSKCTCTVTRPDQVCIATATCENGQFVIFAREPLDLNAALTGLKEHRTKNADHGTATLSEA